MSKNLLFIIFRAFPSLLGSSLPTSDGRISYLRLMTNRANVLRKTLDDDDYQMCRA